MTSVIVRSMHVRDADEELMYVSLQLKIRAIFSKGLDLIVFVREFTLGRPSGGSDDEVAQVLMLE